MTQHPEKEPDNEQYPEYCMKGICEEGMCICEESPEKEPCESKGMEEWEKEFDETFIGNKMLDLFGSKGSPQNLRDFIRHLLLSAREEATALARREERQFILNVLDGIDIADKKMGNTGGGTKAIRLALQSRPIR